MKRAELLRHLQTQGCELLREGGRHHNPSLNKRFAVPRHSEINENLARKICRDLGFHSSSSCSQSRLHLRQVDRQNSAVGGPRGVVLVVADDATEDLRSKEAGLRGGALWGRRIQLVTSTSAVSRTTVSPCFADAVTRTRLDTRAGVRTFT